MNKSHNLYATLKLKKEFCLRKIGGQFIAGVEPKFCFKDFVELAFDTELRKIYSF